MTASTGSYRQLDVEQTIATLQTLRNRIRERFDASSLSRVAGELCELAGESRARIRWIERPHLGLRLLLVLVIFGGIGLAVYGLQEVVKVDGKLALSDLEWITNEIILVGAALLFLFSLEVRVKRTRALHALHDLRAIAHVIDMHQLTKDPSQLLNPNAKPTKSSPKRTLTPFQLTRYLDYCSEMLSLLGKLSALYAQSLPDPVVVAAVNDIETLANGLSRKIWQKIVMLDDVARLVASTDDLPKSHKKESI
ncbi:MAG: hypothetical protein NXI04_13290 [Planctomycetaceae bacterium]|nr:hypothetical protein [Planctomycetaceae bacterium]